MKKTMKSSIPPGMAIHFRLAGVGKGLLNIKSNLTTRPGTTPSASALFFTLGSTARNRFIPRPRHFGRAGAFSGEIPEPLVLVSVITCARAERPWDCWAPGRSELPTAPSLFGDHERIGKRKADCQLLDQVECGTSVPHLCRKVSLGERMLRFTTLRATVFINCICGLLTRELRDENTIAPINGRVFFDPRQTGKHSTALPASLNVAKKVDALLPDLISR